MKMKTRMTSMAHIYQIPPGCKYNQGYNNNNNDNNMIIIYNKSHLNVSITKLRDGAIATSGASTGKRVRGTRCHLFVTIAITMIIMRSIISKNIKFVDDFDWFQCV